VFIVSVSKGYLCNMSRRVIILLIVLMALVMTSLILVQTNSILKALEIKEEQFDAAVNSALSKVAYRIELEESKMLAEREKSISSSLSSGIFPGNNQHSISETISPRAARFSARYSQKASENTITEELHIDYSQPTQQVRNERGRPGDFPNAFDVIEESRGFARQQYEERQDLRARMLQLQTWAVILSESPIEDRINVSTLGRLIKLELKRQGINLDFIYAVKTFPRGEERLISGDKNFSSNQQNEYRALLFPNDDNPKPNWISLYFPKQNSFLLKETGFLVIPTFVLTALLIGIFVFTILIILRQKKLSIIKNDFINNMTHELKTPISTISLAS
jgi:two-component system phosphate regulon sensor histidine kinase PhoR